MLKATEKVFNVVMLFYTVGAVVPFIFGISDGAVRAEGNVPDLATQISLYAVAFCFIAIHWRTVLRAAWSAKWILALILLAIASSAWSQDPLFTLRRSLVLVATTLYAIYFAGRFTIAEQLRLLSWAYAFVVASSLLFAIFLPQYGVDYGGFFGAWQGAFPQKNMLARAMVSSALLFYILRTSTGNWIRWVGIATSLCLLAASRSVTGVLILAFTIVVLWLCKLVRFNFTFSVPILTGIATVGVAVAYLTYSDPSKLLAMVGRDSTLTGRIDLWRTAVSCISRHPWLGYGFNAFWTGMQGESSSILLTVRWYVKHSHNGFLDLALDLGLLGVATFVAGYLVMSKRALQLLRRAPGPASYWLCAFLLLMFLYNLDESSILIQNNIFWVLYVSTAVNIGTSAGPRLSSEALGFDNVS